MRYFHNSDQETVLDTLASGEDVKGTYSLEEEKQKSEMDRKIKEANIFKERKRKEIKNLMTLFEKLKNRNGELPSACQLTNKDFELDPSLNIQAEENLAARLDLIARQNQWDLAKAKLQFEKVHNRFRGEVQEDSITLYAIETKDKVKNIPPFYTNFLLFYTIFFSKKLFFKFKKLM